MGCILILLRLLRPLRRQKSVYKHFSGVGKVFLNTSQASSAPERYEISNTSPAPEKYLYTLFRRRRSAYIHLFGAGEAGEAGEVFIYTENYKSCNIASNCIMA